MFSNGTEAMQWQERNCYRCWKYNDERGDRDKMRCKTSYDIDMGYVGILPDGISLIRLRNITSESVCRYFEEKRPVYKKKDSAMPLFEV